MLSFELDFQNETTFKIKSSLIEEHLKLILRRLGWIGTVVVEVKLVKSSTIQQLNKQFLGSDKPTDVLSFPSEFQVNDAKMLGSIAIAEPVARKQAEEAGITIEDEIKTQAGHGLLHLIGYHHV